MARQPWLDEASQTPLIDDYAQQMGSFLEAMADGKIDDSELAKQESVVADLLKEVEPQLSDEQHESVTKLLCELSVYNMMQMLHMIHEARPTTEFRG